jgi:hypothetical protein
MMFLCTIGGNTGKEQICSLFYTYVRHNNKVARSNIPSYAYYVSVVSGAEGETNPAGPLFRVRPTSNRSPINPSYPALKCPVLFLVDIKDSSRSSIVCSSITRFA